jgi:hypothetical protein
MRVLAEALTNFSHLFFPQKMHFSAKPIFVASRSAAAGAILLA